MAKAVFRPGEAKVKDEKFVLSLMKDYAPEVEEVEEVVEEYTGPSVEDIKREVEAERQKWEAEKQQLISQAQAQANEIIKNAENTSFPQSCSHYPQLPWKSFGGKWGTDVFFVEI